MERANRTDPLESEKKISASGGANPVIFVIRGIRESGMVATIPTLKAESCWLAASFSDVVVVVVVAAVEVLSTDTEDSREDDPESRASSYPGISPAAT